MEENLVAFYSNAGFSVSLPGTAGPPLLTTYLLETIPKAVSCTRRPTLLVHSHLSPPQPHRRQTLKQPDAAVTPFVTTPNTDTLQKSFKKHSSPFCSLIPLLYLLSDPPSFPRFSLDLLHQENPPTIPFTSLLNVHVLHTFALTKTSPFLQTWPEQMLLFSLSCFMDQEEESAEVDYFVCPEQHHHLLVCPPTPRPTSPAHPPIVQKEAVSLSNFRKFVMFLLWRIRLYLNVFR